MDEFTYYVEIIMIGQGTLIKFHTNAPPPRVGDVLSLRDISSIRGERRVLEVTYQYVKHENQDNPNLIVVQILLDETPAKKIDYWT